LLRRQTIASSCSTTVSFLIAFKNHAPAILGL
jgi:hypothetical protein